MSQVKKLQAGGKFIIDGQEISGNDAINAVRPYLGETTGGIMNALRDGHTVDYNSADNTVLITNSEGQSLNNNYLPAGSKASPMDSNFKKNWGATFHTKTDRFKRDLLELRRVRMFSPAKSGDDTASSLINLRKGSGWFYTKDADGNDIFEEGPLNKDRLAAIREFREYVQHYGDFGEEESKKKYKTDGWSSDNLRALQSYFKDIKTDDDRNNYWTELENRIKNNKLKNTDKEVLRLMGFDDSGVSPVESGVTNDSSKPSIASDWVGDKDTAEKLGLGIRKNDEGYWEIYGENPYATGTWYNRGLDFLKGTPWETGAIHNGRLYTQGDVFSGKYLDLSAAMVPFINAWRDETSDWNTRWNNALNSGVNWYGMDNNIYANAGDPTKRYAQYWTRYFTDNGLNGNYNLIDVSNAFSNAGDKQIVSYVDGTNRNAYGIDEPVYLVRDADGNITKYDNHAALMANSGLVENSDIYGFAPKNINMNEYRSIKGKDYAEYGRFGKNGQENTVLIGRDGYLYLSRGDDAKPKRIYDIQKLMSMMAGEAFENKDLDAITLTKGEYRWNPVTPFRQKRSQMIANEQQRRAERENPNLNKFQWGGSIQKVKSSAIANDPSTQKHDYTKAHALDGSDGKLTDAEWMQIGAAVGDLAGVGISFIPGAGNIAGAATGAAASTTKFIADIKQDGYQGKDLGNYLANLGLDAATLIPVLGTGAKSVKAAKIIKSAGKPIIKLLSITGAAAPVITAVKKIQNGEKYTSEDLATAIRGIGAGIIATKSIKDSIGEARLAKTVAENAAKSSNNITQNGITKTAEEIAKAINGKSKLDATKELRSLFKNGDVELSQSDATKLLDDLNVTWNKGKIQNWKLKRFGSGKNRGHKTVEFTPTEARSTTSYLLRPFKRADVLGSEAVFGFGKKPGLLNNTTYEALDAAIKAPKATLEQQALLRMTAENPKAFGDWFTWKDGSYAPIITRPGVYFGGNRYYREITPSWIKEPPQQFDVQAYLNNLGVDAPISLGYHYAQPRSTPADILARRARIKNYIRPFKQEYSNPELWQATMMGSYKKGGKILKGQEGLNKENWYKILHGKKDDPSDYWNNFLNSDEGQAWYDSFGKIETLTPAVITAERMSKPVEDSVSESSLDPTNQTVIGSSTTKKENGVGTNTGNGNGSRDGGLPGEGAKVNLPNLDDMLRAGVSARAIYADRDLQRKALGELFKRQFQTAHADRMRYNFSDIRQAGNEARKPILDSRFVSSDSRDVLAFNLAKAQQLAAQAGQENTQITQRKSQIDDVNRQIDYQNQLADVQTANQKSQYITGLKYQDAMLDSVALNRLFSDVINPLGQQMSQQGRDAWNKKLALEHSMDTKAEDSAELQRRNFEIRAKYGDEWAKLSDADRLKWGDIDTFAYSKDPDWYNALTTPSKNYREKIKKLNDDYFDSLGAGVFIRKSGGTINIKNTNKNQRSAQEQIAINGHKAAKRSVDELSKALMKMLQQLTK